jgi:hypothetical protein
VSDLKSNVMSIMWTTQVVGVRRGVASCFAYGAWAKFAPLAGQIRRRLKSLGNSRQSTPRAGHFGGLRAIIQARNPTYLAQDEVSVHLGLVEVKLRRPARLRGDSRVDLGCRTVAVGRVHREKNKRSGDRRFEHLA